jgi:hypothetical protein
LMSSISDGALWKFKQHMLAMGADPELMAPGSEVDTDDIVRECVGAEVRLVIKTEQYTAKDGTEKERSTIAEIQPALPF